MKTRVTRRGVKHPRGQALVLAVVAMAVLWVVSLFLLDLQGMLRLTARTQAGADSAMIEAATWQVRPINVIGEMNLLKAATVLIRDLPPYGDDWEAGILDSADLLAEMQARTSYAAPRRRRAAAATSETAFNGKSGQRPLTALKICIQAQNPVYQDR